MRPVRIFTPDNLLRIRQMAAAGSSAIEIAKSIGSTPASVKNVCCRYKIKIRRRDRKSARNVLSELAAYLPVTLSIEFHRKAEDLHMPASVLASRLLAAIVDSNIYEAVLDERDWQSVLISKQQPPLFSDNNAKAVALENPGAAE